MAQLPTAVDDKDLIAHFPEMIAPYCLMRKSQLGTAVVPNYQPMITCEDDIVSRIEESLVSTYSQRYDMTFYLQVVKIIL